MVLIIATILSLIWARELNLLGHGEIQAKSLGIHTDRLQIKIYFLSALLTATAVSTTGTIAFIGLIAPHCMRLIIGNEQRYLIPTTILFGGILLTTADMLARTIIAPQELPVGIITTLIGAPIFLFLLIRGTKT